jgi:hypothetical protein
VEGNVLKKWNRLIISALSLLIVPNLALADPKLRKKNSSRPVFTKLTYQANIGFQNLNYLRNRSEHSLNDQEALDADLHFIFDNEKNAKIDLDPRVRVDFMDSNRNRFIPYEAYLMFYGPHVETSAGLRLKPWGVSASFNPTDVINRKDYAYNYYNPEKLPEVMATFKYSTDQWSPFSQISFEVMALPLLWNTPLPGNNSRFAIRGDFNDVPYTLLNQPEKPGYPSSLAGAFRFGASIKSVDFSFHYYHGPEHDPGFVGVIDSQGALRVRPFYYLIDMLGTNIEASVGKLILRGELAYKMTGINDPKHHEIPFVGDDLIPSNYLQFVIGVEYGFHQIIRKGDLTLIAEYLGEDHHSNLIQEFRPFKNDIFFGMRYDFNNLHLTQAQFGLIKDLSNRETLWIMDINSKIYKELKLGLRGVIVNPDPNSSLPLSFFPNNTYIMARFSYSFGGQL